VSADHDQVTVKLDAIQVGFPAGVGQVVDVGARAQGLRDRRVLVGPIDPCGECDVCRSGGVAVCPHVVRRDALGTLVIAAARWVVPLDDGLELASPQAAAVAGDVALAYTLYARAGVGPRDPVVVVGATPITRFLVEILIAKGITPAAIATPGPWADWLAARGVAVAVDRAALAAALAAQSLGTRPWRLLCADPAAIGAAVELAGPRASLTSLAGAAPASLAGAAPASLAASALSRELTIVGVAAAHPDLVVEAAAMCVRGELDLVAGTTSQPSDPLRTHVRMVR
jgi:D-arabinose 1-dehydrogenase-like Zn-dependent alcohol dehydrogenase